MKNPKYTGKVDIDLLNDNLFMSIHEKIAPYTMTSIERQYALYKSVQYILENNINGDFVECGVWKGGSAMLIAYVLNEYKVKDRKIYLYDTFAGMPEPTSKDLRYNHIDTHATWESRQKGEINEWCYASLEETKVNIETTKYPIGNIIFVKGKVEDTFSKILPESISLMRLDTDWYESTKNELEYLFPILTIGGVLIVDDYGCWQGAREATDEYIEKNGLNVLLNRIDYTGRIAIKLR